MLSSLILGPAPVAPTTGSSRRCSPHGEVEARVARFARELPRRAPLATCASTSTASLDTTADPSIRPSCWKEHWPPPGPSKFIRDKRAFVEEHRIRGYEVGPDQHASIVTVANLLQEVASNHAVAMWGRSAEGFAADPALAELGLIFVMTRMQVQMDVYPRWGDLVSVKTWFQESGKVGAQRDWVITDAGSGATLGRATSTWVMININTRRLSKMPESMRQRCAWYQMDPPANAIPAAFCRLKIPEVPAPAGAAAASRFVARRGDMDMNGHINNVVYFAWGLETVPEAVYQGAHLYQMEVDFKAECLCGDVIEAHGAEAALPAELAANGAGPGALTYGHTLLRAEEGGKMTELVRARTIWRVGDAA